MSHSASGSGSPPTSAVVMISSSASWSMTVLRSCRMPLMRAPMASRSIRSPIPAATSAGVTGWSKDLTEPSGSVMRGMGGIPWGQGLRAKEKGTAGRPRLML
jgi:hypothetical protein